MQFCKFFWLFLCSLQFVSLYPTNYGASEPPGSRVPGTGEVSQPIVVEPPEHCQGTFIVAPSFVRAFGASTSTGASLAPW